MTPNPDTRLNAADFTILLGELDRAERRVQELEGALKRIADSPPQREGWPPLHWARDIARTALEAARKPDGKT